MDVGTLLAPGRRDTRPAARLERVLAVGRAFLTVTGFVAIYLDPTQPTRLAELTYTVLAGYALYSLAVLAYVQRAPRLDRGHSRLLHGLDILWTSVLTFVSDGPGSPFFLFFLFVVLAAAYRWGFSGTMATTLVTVGIFLLEAAVSVAGPWQPDWLASGDLELNRTILRVGYLLLTGFLLAYLAEQDKDARIELAAIAEAARQPRVDVGLSGSVTAVSVELLRVFDADAVCFVLRDDEKGEGYLWRLDRAAPTASLRRELGEAELRAWLFAGPGRAWYGVGRPGVAGLAVRVAEAGIWPLRRGAIDTGPPLTTGRLLVADLGLAEQWRGRVYLIEPAVGRSAERAVHFLEALAEHVTPALTNVLLLGRLREQATAAERARVARELHDGAIQALIGLEMKLEALRRGPEPLPPAADREIQDVQELMRREVLALRELMQALRPIGLDTSEQLPDVLAHVVERFRRDTGVPARFVFTGGRVAVTPPKALELVRVVQEALVNVRRHSRASNVLVRLSGGEGQCLLVVEDDGIGLGFDGRLSGEELDRRRLGPAIIRERARIVGADLAIESGIGAGVRIELLMRTA